MQPQEQENPTKKSSTRNCDSIRIYNSEQGVAEITWFIGQPKKWLDCDVLRNFLPGQFYDRQEPGRNHIMRVLQQEHFE